MYRAEKIGLNLGKPLTSGLCILNDPYMIPGCEHCEWSLLYKSPLIYFLIPFKLKS